MNGDESLARKDDIGDIAFQRIESIPLASVSGGEDDTLVASRTHGDESTEAEGDLVKRQFGERNMGWESGSGLPDLAID